MIGQIKQKKGGLFFLESLLASGHADRFHLLFIGELEEAVLSWVIEHHEAISFTTIPFADRYELLPYYAACDMMVIPSFYDGLPNVLLEAAALGIPLLASTAGGMNDLLVDNQHGYLFHPGDMHGCRRAVDAAALAPEEELKRLGDECTMLVQNGFDHLTEARSYRDMFTQTMKPAEVNGVAQPIQTIPVSSPLSIPGDIS
jgi:glycosyltransferase involved in cell wall biosynthesis